MNGLPLLATTGNDEQFGGALSYLPGQRLSRCTCPGESHPGPVHSDGTYVGRSAPEIDMIEAQVGHNFVGPGTAALVGEVSQSGQWAVSRVSISIHPTLLMARLSYCSLSIINTNGSTAPGTSPSTIPRLRSSTVTGVVCCSRRPLVLAKRVSRVSPDPKTSSDVSLSDQRCYDQMPNPCFTLYGFEYKPGFDDSVRHSPFDYLGDRYSSGTMEIVHQLD